MKKKCFVIIGILFLLIGIFIYLFYRSNSLLFFSWLDFINIKSINGFDFNHQSKIQSFLVYSLPNMLWYISFLLIMIGIWGNNKKCFTLYFCLISLISVGSEILQLFYIIPGTFDIVDLLSMIICIIVAFIVYFNFLAKRSFI